MTKKAMDRFKRGVIVRHKSGGMNMLVLRSSGHKTSVAYCELDRLGTLRIRDYETSDLRQIVGLDDERNDMPFEGQPDSSGNEEPGAVPTDSGPCEIEPKEVSEDAQMSKRKPELAEFFKTLRAKQDQT